jgi:glycosyltransferase involved in cell wall biosynthesis
MARIFRRILLWQSELSPHMTGFARALARFGHDVTYASESTVTSERLQLGWRSEPMPDVKLKLLSGKNEAIDLAKSSSSDVIHVCQGFRSNGVIYPAQKVLRDLRRRQWVAMEGVNDRGWKGPIKRAIYRGSILKASESIDGVLATGLKTRGWLVDRGMQSDKVYPFAYFVDIDADVKREALPIDVKGTFTFVFAGQLIRRKRIDWMLRALSCVLDFDFQILIVGTGPLRAALENQSDSRVAARTTWLGGMTRPLLANVLKNSDCLVLPSEWDGWGSVASEALMCGTPVVCSSACGVADMVAASKESHVFSFDSFVSLVESLRGMLEQGRIDEEARRSLSSWANASIASDAGAQYLSDVFDACYDHQTVPCAPWVVRG